MAMYIECDLGSFSPGTLSRANTVCTWLYHLIPDIFKEFAKMQETSEFENNFMHEMIGQYLVMANSFDGNLKSPSMSECRESVTGTPGKRKRGSFGDYVSKVDQFIRKQTDETDEEHMIRTRLSRQYGYVYVFVLLHQSRV